MDIENFIAEFKKTFVYDMLKDYVTDEKLFDHFVTENGDIVFLKEQTRQMWSMWQAAKAIPEGFVVVPKEPTQKMLDATINLAIPAVYVDSISGQHKLKVAAYYKAMINKAQEPANESN